MRIPPNVSSGFAMLLCVTLSGCSKRTTETEPAPETPAPVTVATPKPATPPPPTPAPATPPPVAKRLAPPGTFYLLVKKSVETSDGIIGFKPGTQVKQEADGAFTAEGHKLDVRANEITNDLDIAARFAGADAMRQAAVRQVLATPVAAPAASVPGAPTASAPQTAARPTSSGPSIAAGQRSPAALGASSALGASHTMTRDGWLWQKDANGNWTRVKPLR